MLTVILCGLPTNCLESDIHRALLTEGTAVDIQLIRQLQLALVTMRTQAEALGLLAKGTVSVVGISVRVVQGPNLYAAAAAAAAAQAAQVGYAAPALQSSSGAAGPTAASPNTSAAPPSTSAPGQSVANGSVLHETPTLTADGGRSVFPTGPSAPSAYTASADARSPRLTVRVQDCRYPITRDLLLQMFTMVAPPLQVSCGPPGPETLGDVTFTTADAAARAMEQFHGKNIYPGCCLLQLAYAPLLGSGEVGVEPPPVSGHSPDPESVTTPLAVPTCEGRSAAPQMEGQQTMADRPPPAPSHHHLESAQPEQEPPPPPQDPPHVSSTSSRYPESELMPVGLRGGRGLAARGGLGRGATGAFDPLRAPPPPRSHVRPFTDGPPYPPDSAQARRVEVSGVPLCVPLLDLFTLLEVFGNVGPIWRRAEERTTVVAQFQNTNDARAAVFLLDGCPMRGGVLRLRRYSGPDERIAQEEWNAGPPSDPATRAFLPSMDFHHRTKPTAPFNPHGRVRPVKDLFVANLMDSINDTEVLDEFRKANVVVESYRRKDAMTALVGLRDVEAAVDALVAVHGKLLKGRFLRVNFSRFPTVEGREGDSAKESGAPTTARRGSAEGEEAAPSPYSTALEPSDENGAAVA